MTTLYNGGDRFFVAPQPPHRVTAVLCPNCRRLVSADEPHCPHCGLSSPGARWKHSFLAKGLTSGRQLVNILIIVNSILYFFSYLVSMMTSPEGFQLSTNPLALLSPDGPSLLLLGGTGTLAIDHFHRWWSLVSASYLHGGIFHLLFNMMALRQIAPLVIQEYGTCRMFSIYTASGVGGFLLSYVAGVPLTIGASAAICGLIGAALYYGKHRGGTYGQEIYRQMGGWAIGIILFGLFFPDTINNWGHGGGLASGIVMGMILGYHERKPETFAHRLLAGILAAGTALILMWAVGTPLLYLFVD